MQMFTSSATGTLRRTAVAAATGAALMMAASSSMAAIVWSGTVNLTVPNDFGGLYLNLVSGQSGTTPSAAPGWDINPFGTGVMQFFTSTTAPNSTTNSGITGVVALNATIGPGSTFSSGTVTPLASLWNLNSTNNYVGLRFLNEPTGTTHFGWIQMGFGANLGIRSIVSYAFESTPLTAIQAGVIPEPGTYALMGLGLAGLMVAARRRKQA